MGPLDTIMSRECGTAFGGFCRCVEQARHSSIVKVTGRR
jgi:hypothetical protein